jgi:hypothetical protein
MLPSPRDTAPAGQRPQPTVPAGGRRGEPCLGREQGSMGTGPELTTRIDAPNGVTGILLSGELDIATAPKLVDQPTACNEDGTKAIVLDVRELREGGP